MSAQCCNCTKPVTNETAGTAAPACDDCRARWRTAEVNRATQLLEAHGYTVTPPTPSQGTTETR